MVFISSINFNIMQNIYYEIIFHGESKSSNDMVCTFLNFFI
jgi:hypothetical protein